MNKSLVFAAQALIRGQIVAGFRNIDERQFQQLIIENDKRKINTIVLGSSRSLEIRERSIKNIFKSENDINFFNHSVSGASIEDYIAIVGLYKKVRGYIPKRIIIGLDPWVFNKNSGQNRWKSIEKFYNMLIEEIYDKKLESPKTLSLHKTKYAQLINWDYTIANIESLFVPSKRNRFHIVNSIDIDESLRAPDGSNYYPYKIRYKSDDIVQREAKNYTNPPVYSLENFFELTNIKIFEDFIQFLKKHNVEVILFLPPYHPLSYEILINKNEYKIIEEVEKYLKNYAANHNIKLLGSYNPKTYNLQSIHFYDGMHWRDTAAKILFEAKP